MMKLLLRSTIQRIYIININTYAKTGATNVRKK